MSLDDRQARYAGCRCFRAFFESYSEWQKKRALFGFAEDIEKQEYDDFLKGTSASVRVPLWASACKENGRVLINEITLEVIRYYKSYGYSPVLMDGNPADYIGEQFRFLEYLSRLEMRTPGKYEQAIDGFIDAFTLDTIRAIYESLTLNGTGLAISAVIERAAKLVKGEPFTASLELSDLEIFDSFLWDARPALPVADERFVCSSGINNCGGRCRINISALEGCVLHLESDTGPADSPRILSCVRGKGYRRTFLSANRIRYPMKRIGERGEGKFKRISWEEAIEEIASETARIGDTYGPQSRFVIYATGVNVAFRGDKLMMRLLSLAGGYLGYYNTYSSACAMYTIPYVYGSENGVNAIEDILNTRLLILWGHNPSETLFGTYTNYYITELKRKGVRIVVIDPRRSDSVLCYADEWIGLKPSTDSALADAMAHVIWSEGLRDQSFMDRFCLGFDESHMPEGVPEGESYHTYLFGLKDGVPKTPEWAEKITGVPSSTIESLAREYARTKPACLIPGLGPQRTGNGEQTVRSIAMLSCLTGNVGVPGGGAGCYGKRKGHSIPQMPVIPNPYPGIIPTFLWSKAIENGVGFDPVVDGLKGVDKLDTNIKMLFNLAGNTLINQHSNINETIKILRDTSKCEMIVVSDIFMTPSSKFADILLPAPSLFENDNIAASWTLEDFLLHSTKAVEPLFECRFEYYWMKEVARKLGVYERFTEGHETVEEWLEAIYEKNRKLESELPPYALFRENGGYQYKQNTIYIAFQEEIETGKPFATPSGKIEIFSKRLYDMNNPQEIPGIPRYVPCVEGPEDPLKLKFPLQLIGYHTKRRCHSIHDINEWLEEVDPPAIWMHPRDAEERGIKNGDNVRVFNDRGALVVPAKVEDRIIQGVVALSQGGWYAPDKNGVDRRGSINVLTHTYKPTPLAKGNPQHTNLVEVAKSVE
jgi:anaerobic dimethyl sulfoxide reductase subunit A